MDSCDYDWTNDRTDEAVGSTKRKSASTRRKRKELQFPDLVAPLSEWGRQAGVEPKDIEAFATRDIKNRIAQAEKNGYIKRNLNVFFLYKRAFRDVAQAWMEIHHPALAKTQPPLVTLVGESWSKESDEFKKSYTFYSDLEREGLRRAFPNYKYKPGTKKEQQPAKGSSAKQMRDFDQDATHYRQSSESSSGYGSNDQAFQYGHSRQPHGNFESPLGRGSQAGHVGGPLVGHEGEFSEPPYYHSGSSPLPMGYISPSPSMMGEPLSLPLDFEHSFLHPQRAEAHSFSNGRMRSESPALSHHSPHHLDGVPIDPSLSSSYSDYFPSRANSEEPGCIVPSQMHHHMQPVLAHSHRWQSSDSFATSTDDPFGLPMQLPSSMMGSRCTSEEPWQEAADSVLSSVPVGDMMPSQLNNMTTVEWQLDSLSHNETVQPPGSWEVPAWAFDFGDRDLDDEG